MTAINVFMVAPERQANGTKASMYAEWRTPDDYDRMRAGPDASPFLAEALTIARFDPGFYEVVDVFTSDVSP
ncbi:MAG TPA: hypothetical protein VGH32_13615 [Pirellulales bacterium]